ncbi:MAG: hypothetical protein K2O12_07055 [Muribaculaceae bacterium]|nr:hypothetical protein [Muribaculaceae bacterium]
MDMTSVFLTAIVFVSIYKMIELFVRRNERMAIINKLHTENSRNIDFGKLNINSALGSSQKFTALKWGAFAIGLGIGLLVYFIIVINCSEIDEFYFLKSTLSGSLCLIGGGLGLIIAFLIENAMQKSDRNQNI